MIITLKQRKTVHILLFISIIIIQLFVYKIGFSQKKNQNNLTESIQNAIKPNQALIYSNRATKSYFDAGNHFNTFLQNHNKNSLENYQNAIKSMSLYLDSLSIISNKDKDFMQVIKAKQVTEKQVIRLRWELDSLMGKSVALLPQKKLLDFNVKKYDYNKVLSSITYDTIKTSTEVKKKGLFGRIGSALAGKSDVKKEEIQSKIKMVFNNEEKTGSFEDQIKNIFLFSEKYYENEFSKTKNTYNNLKKKDIILLQINKIILDKSQNILLFYSQSTEEAAKLKYTNAINLYNLDVKNQKQTFLYLLLGMGIVTILLLLYTIYSYKHEDNLAKAKTDSDNNLDQKNRLVGMLSHEMRAPLSIISNFSGKLKTKNTNPELFSIIDSLHFTSNSLQITTNQILDFFKNENTKLVLYNSKINLKKEVTSILDSLKSLSETKKINIISNIDASLDKTVWADNVKIHQLFYNIIGNALKFTKEGTITVDTKLSEINNKLKFEVKIKDTGLGIPKEDKEKVFNTFYQSKTHNNLKGFGAGLGLSLCKEIIELFGGEITIESEIDKGTEVSFFLFFEKSIAEQETNKTKLINKFKNKQINVAVVDDDNIILAVIKKLVTAVNFNIVAFDNALAIKKHLETEIVDLIITDIQIFDYSGIELANDIKNLKNKNATCPIIALTADSYMSLVDLETINMDEIIIKPINKEEFYLKVLKVLEKG